MDTVQQINMQGAKTQVRFLVCIVHGPPDYLKTQYVVRIQAERNPNP